MRDVGADLGGSGSGSKADSEAAARRRKMTIQLREARRSLSEPDAIPSHSSAMVRLFAEINRSATPMLGHHRARRLRDGAGLGRRRPADDLDHFHRLRDR